jgi:hypothetical protein
LPERVIGDANPSGIGDAFESRGDFDAVAQVPVALFDNVSETDADPEIDPPVCVTSALRSTIALWISMA